MQTTDTHKLNIVPFRYSSDWLYYPNVDMEYRFILGTRGRNPIIVIGLNPSTATPEQPDPTIKRVSAIASHNGYDSFVMLNLYAQRATIPGNLDVELNRELHGENLKAFEWALDYVQKVNGGAAIPVWCAWGNLIKSREYLPGCWEDMLAILRARKAELLCVSITNEKQPIHPLYQKNTSLLIEWKT
ncbi:MAG: DUF1643 domain-containing protein [Clostridia bacterium]|nr:DUF1643 domain-containing protein [Clostridia bacterium]MBQ5487782.1 DUF1643 domain-containing protein [Clostridia bacterium]